jgi:GAF domain-containing protein
VEFERVLTLSGIHGALRFLNARTRFRFTGVYRADPPLLRNLHLFDRENPTLNVSGNVSPLADTYCAITCATDWPFSTPDAPRDARLTGHAALNSVLCYAGVPIRLDGGCVFGTLCHFDVRPRLIPPGELTVLERVAPLVARWLSEHGSAS